MREKRAIGLGICIGLGGAVCLLLATRWVRPQEKGHPSVPVALTSACGIIRWHHEQAGVGFFVRAEGRRTNTCFVTAAHVINDVARREGKQDFSLQVWVRQKGGDGAAACPVPCNPGTLSVLPAADLAVVTLEPGVVSEGSGYGVTPLVVPVAGRAVNKRSPAILTRALRKAMDIRVGDDLFMLTALPCDPSLLSAGFFPVIFRKGCLAFIKEQGGDMKSGVMMADCPSFKGSSGSPVFAVVTRPDRWGEGSKEAHLLGVATDALTVRGHVAQENSGLTGLAPVDGLFTWLQQRDME